MILLQRTAAVLLLGLLAGCASQASVVPMVGAVVSCNSISRSNVATGLVFPCLDGKSALHFSALRGPLIVNVWGSWCAPCKDEVPIIRTFYAKAKSQVPILGVDVEEAKPSDGTAFILKNGMTWPNVIDPDGRSRGYFGMGVPVTWFINSKGVVVHKKIGAAQSERELRDLTLKYLHITVG
jgi:cytochrome c biogenesis protein CcmG/thiol:disulfide interchange protein DsbE